MRPVNPIDQLFLRLEGRHQPMHVGGIKLFKLPDDAPEDFVQQLVLDLRKQIDIQPPFDQRLTARLGMPCWTRDKHFDIEHHVRHLALPHPGGIRELLTLISHQHSALLDRTRPLWECYVIEGVSDNRFAMYYKLHHSVMDGVSAMRLCREALTDRPDDYDHLPDVWNWEPTNRSVGARDALAPVRRSLQTAGRAARSVPGVGRSLYTSWRQRGRHPDYTGFGQAPRCILNQRITGSRRFTAHSFSLEQVKRIGQQHGATVNDMVLALCSSALRRYLQDLDALPEASLVAMVPISLHKPGDECANKVSMICASLATHLPDPVDRLAAIQRSVDYWKQRYTAMPPAQALGFTAVAAAPAGLNLFSGVAPEHPAFNVVISNVPGPDQPLYLRGAELQELSPVSIAMDGVALNMTVVSYDGKLEFGLTACRRTLPSIQLMVHYLQDALEELKTPEALHSAA